MINKLFKTDFINLFKLSTPIMLGMLLQSLFAMADTYFVAKLGPGQMAAVSLGGSVLWTMISMTVFVTAATTAIIARAKGAKDQATITAYAGSTTLLALIIGLGLGGLSLVYKRNLVNFLYKPDAPTLDMVVAYLDILFMGFVVFFLSSNGRSIVQALGDTRTPLVVFGAANILNIILDPIFIFTLNMGIQGAALATVLANVIACMVIYGLIIKRLYGSRVGDFMASLKVSRGQLKDVVKIGSWDVLQAIARPITGMMMFRMVLEIGGANATAAFGVGGQLFNYTFIILVGLSMSISILTGQSLGRGDADAVKRLMKESFLVAGLNMLIFAIPYLVFADDIFRFFRDDAQIIGHGVAYLQWVYPGVTFAVFSMIFSGVFKGAGATKEPMIASMTANVALKLPLAYLLAYHTPMGIKGIWLAISLSVVIEAVIMAIFYQRGRWQRVDVY